MKEENKKEKKKKTDEEKIQEIVQEQLPEEFHQLLDQIMEDEPFLRGRNLFDNMSYGSRRVQELCNLTFD